MKFPTMFSPIRIGTVTVPNRFVVPPMGNNFANTDGTLSDRSLAYYQARAKGGFGLITIESTVVYKEAKGGPRKPCLFSDESVESFRRVADACHAYGAKVSIQLQHAGPEGNSALTGYPLKAASAVPAAQGREIPEAVSNEEIYRIIECYGDAARRAQEAGIDMVEVHCAHGYLVSTFISQRTNHRTDEFGGCFENRMRLPRLIIENIRRKTGGNLPILCRINASDEVEGGQTVQDAAAVAAYLEQECGVDGIHVTRAVHLHDEFMWAPGITHGGFNADLVSEIKRAVSVPVIAVGRFTEPQYAELLVKQGRADLIAFGRQSIADPELPNKARTGHLEELSPCIGCLLGCVPNMFAGKPITCAVNPCVGREAELKRAAQSKRVVIVGGGLVGCEAGLFLQKTGHEVTVVEMLPQILPQTDGECAKLLAREMSRRGIRILNGTPLSEIKCTARGVSGKVGAETVSGIRRDYTKSARRDPVLLFAGSQVQSAAQNEYRTVVTRDGVSFVSGLLIYFCAPYKGVKLYYIFHKKTLSQKYLFAAGPVFARRRAGRGTKNGCIFIYYML